MKPAIRTIGHSTRSFEEFIRLLTAHQIQQLVDVRRYPFSRRHPHFNGELLAKSLSESGIAYTHAPGLGGRRKARPDSVNLGWRNESFRGYADYMQTDEFAMALKELLAQSQHRATAIMCAEAVPWRCHRQLIADALVSRGWTVRHIMSREKAGPHSLTPFVKLESGLLIYPEPKETASTPSLF